LAVWATTGTLVAPLATVPETYHVWVFVPEVVAMVVPETRGIVVAITGSDDTVPEIEPESDVITFVV
jgi:hypothetical protein